MPDVTPLADPSDVQRAWRPFGPAFTADQVATVSDLVSTASAKLRQACPFDIDVRIANWEADPQGSPALDPIVVADVVATVVKRFLVNLDGVASSSDAVGPYSHSATYVNRYDKTGSDVRGAIQIIDSDIDQLRDAEPTRKVRSVPIDVTRTMRPRPGYLPEYGGYLPGWPDSDTPDFTDPDGNLEPFPWQIA